MSFGNSYTNMVIMSHGYVNTGSLSHTPTPNYLQLYPGIFWTLKNVKLMFELLPSRSIGPSSGSEPLYSAWYPLAVKNCQDSCPAKSHRLPWLGDGVLQLWQRSICLQTAFPCYPRSWQRQSVKLTAQGVSPASSPHGSQLAQAAS